MPPFSGGPKIYILILAAAKPIAELLVTHPKGISGAEVFRA